MKSENAGSDNTNDHLRVLPNATNSTEGPIDRDVAGEPGNQQAGQAERAVHLRAPSFTDRPTRIIAGVGLLATIIGLIVNYLTFNVIQGQLKSMDAALVEYRRQAQASEDAVAVAKTALASSDRPWLYPIPTPTGLPVLAQPFKVTLNLINSGRSPAVDSTAQMRVEIKDENDPGPDENPCELCAETVVAPTSQLPYTATISADNITQEVINDVQAGRKFIFVFMRTDYKDAAGALHYSLFCDRFDVDLASLTACDRSGSNAAN